MSAIIYLIPLPIVPNYLTSIPDEVKQVVPRLQYFVVENIRTARRFIKSINKEIDIDKIVFLEIDKHKGLDKTVLLDWFNNQFEIGLMSEAGCPAVADPGHEIIALAHQNQYKVKPLVGPSSILLALMASGFNGQNFAFQGYLPIKEPQRSQKIKAIELVSKQENQTQIFIETPYRNEALFNELLKFCNLKTELCVAQNISGENESITSMTIGQWQIKKPQLSKEPTIFLIYSTH